MLAFAHGGAAREAVSVSALLEQVAQWLRPALRGGVRLTIRTQAPDLMVRANAPSLVSAVLNLATNALQAATGPLDLELLARRSGAGRAQIVVSDNGPGVPAQIRAANFRTLLHHARARQRHRTVHRQVRGRGAWRQRASGRLELRRHVRHRTSGRGSCMSKLNESVLVVEDDAALREALLDTLRAAGLAALAAARCPGGIAAARGARTSAW